MTSARIGVTGQFSAVDNLLTGEEITIHRSRLASGTGEEGQP